MIHSTALQVEQALSLRKERVQRYARYYEFAAAVDVAALKYDAADPVLQHQRTLLQLVRAATSASTYAQTESVDRGECSQWIPRCRRIRSLET